jgi:hypothetical protein
LFVFQTNNEIVTDKQLRNIYFLKDLTFISNNTKF